MVSRDSLPEGLLSDVKNYLNITWDDEATDAKISGLIASGTSNMGRRRTTRRMECPGRS